MKLPVRALRDNGVIAGTVATSPSLRTNRRSALATGIIPFLATLTGAQATTANTAATAASDQKGISSAALAMRLSKVPFYAITTSDGDQPYFTSKAKNGSPVAVFFAEKKDADAILPQVQKLNDPEAIVTAIPLNSCWDLVSTPDEVGNGGIFKLQSSRRQIVNANGNVGLDLKLEKEDKVPLFFDRRIKLSEGGEDAFPFFFKLEDLEKVFSKGAKATAAEAASQAGALAPSPMKVNVEVTTLDGTIAAMLAGNSVANADKIVLVSSESF